MAQRLTRRGRNGTRAALAALPLLVVASARADAPPPIAPPPPPTLARALAAIPPPKNGVLLAVGADTVNLPPNTVAPAQDETDVVPIAAAYGDETQTFGAVVAVAPAMRVVLNENPGPPELPSDLNPYIAFKTLAASLDDAQWALLISERGLGMGDLTDDTQRALFHGLFHHGRLWVAPLNPAKERLPDAQRTDTRDVSDQLDGVRVRLGQSTYIQINDRAGKELFFGDRGEAGRMHTWSPKQEPPVPEYGVALRADVANAPRPGDLPPKDAALATPIPLAGLKTVDDLVARIAVQTHREIYADPHYARRPLTIIGSLPAAPASGLLGALALALAGTYRKVGPAFVLTDDLAGVGARRLRLEEWQEAAREQNDADASKATRRIGDALFKRRASALALSAFGDPLGLTPVQLAGLKDDTATPGVPDGEDHYPFAKLTPAQQGLVRRLNADYQQQLADGTLPSFLTEDGIRDINPTGPVSLSPVCRVQLLIPTVEGPVDTDMYGTPSGFFSPGEAASAVGPERQAAPLAPPSPPTPPLLPLLHSRARRSVLARPKTAADVDALVAGMKAVGLNDLYLDVFSGGVSHLSATGTDIITEALRQTAGTGISVYADLSLLNWGTAPPQDIRDLSLSGEDVHALAVRVQEAHPARDGAGRPLAFVPPPVPVSPFSASVRGTLTTLVRGLASRPGLAGFVWEDAQANGYLGYTPEMRLAFLRRFHADPLDITPTYALGNDLSLPTFDDAAQDKTLPDVWDKARFEVNLGLLMGLRESLPPSAAAGRMVLMGQNRYGRDWLTTWDDPRLPPLVLQTPPYVPGRVALVRLEWVPDGTPTRVLALRLQFSLASKPPGGRAAWDGYVLDFRDAAATGGGGSLAALVQAVQEERDETRTDKPQMSKPR